MQALGNGSLKELERAAIDVLKRLSQFININTVFVTRYEEEKVEVMHSFNRNRLLIEKGLIIDAKESYCQVIIDSDRESLVIEDITSHPTTGELELSQELNQGSLLGVPIHYNDGRVYGTLCGLDNNPKVYKEEEIELFKTMAGLLGYVIDLDEVNCRVQDIGTPVVPVDDGVAILPLTGEVDERRSEIIMEQVLQRSYQDAIEYLIIDVSGLAIENHNVSDNICRLSVSIQLLGATPILTGVRPDQAIFFHHSESQINRLTAKSNLKEALKWIGFQLVKPE
ncbi:GAF domain-containing protein [Salipaludibacillus sp. CUR1]|uniref:GAF domain-containing protein n=1 Tax=Salipaludibacillus sp. CUR1 TaxID=2820003 RepID=UPI001E61A311|nr:GAF domain-containing protein [Salipaludibacillus sp. CUR1]